MSLEDLGHPDLSESIVRAVAAPLFVLDWRGIIKIWNQRMATLTGISGAQAQGRYAAESCLAPEDRERWARQLELLSADTPRAEFAGRWKTASGLFEQMRCDCVLTDVQDAERGMIVCTISKPETPPENELLEHDAELDDYARYLHQTLAQDLVQLSFHIDGLTGMKMDSRRDLIERCCNTVRVVTALLAPRSRGISFVTWLQDYAAFFRAEIGLEIELDLDPPPADISESVTGLFATVTQVWIARIVRTPSVSPITVRLREKAEKWILQLDSSDVPAERLLGGWSLLGRRAEELGGAFHAAKSATGVVAILKLPVSMGTGASV
jgi:PAS domain S-box-containing protein